MVEAANRRSEVDVGNDVGSALMSSTIVSLTDTQISNISRGMVPPIHVTLRSNWSFF